MAYLARLLDSGGCGVPDNANKTRIRCFCSYLPATLDRRLGRARTLRGLAFTVNSEKAQREKLTADSESEPRSIIMIHLRIRSMATTGI